MGKEVKQTNSWVWKKVLGMTILGWINILILQWLFIRLSYHWVYVDPATDEDTRVDTFWDDEKSNLLQKLSTTMPLSGVFYLYRGGGETM